MFNLLLGSSMIHQKGARNGLLMLKSVSSGFSKTWNVIDGERQSQTCQPLDYYEILNFSFLGRSNIWRMTNTIIFKFVININFNNRHCKQTVKKITILWEEWGTHGTKNCWTSVHYLLPILVSLYSLLFPFPPE